MDDVTRRSLLQGTGAAVAAAGFIQEAQARTEAFGPTDPYDLIVRGGEVVDPSQNLRGKRDIGIRNAQIATIEPEIPVTRRPQTLHAPGPTLPPGPRRLHFHGPPGRRNRAPRDELVPYTGCTTY